MRTPKSLLFTPVFLGLAVTCSLSSCIKEETIVVTETVTDTVYVGCEGCDSTLADGLVAFFPFTGNAGDSSATALNGTVSGAVLTTGVDGASNAAYSFDGVDDYINAGTDTRSVTNVVAISLWYKTDADVVNAMAAKYSISLNKGWTMGFTTTGTNTIASSVRNGSSASATLLSYTTSDNADGEWHHYLVMLSDAGYELWLDGELETSLSSLSGSEDYALASVPFRIGCLAQSDSPAANAAFFDGTLDQVRIYNRLLTEEEIACIYMHKL